MAVRKIWRCHYIGTHNQAPQVIDVPSENTTGMPTGKEFVEALKKMGYDDGLAHSIASGGSNLCWKCEDSGLKPEPENEEVESTEKEQDERGNLLGFAFGTLSMFGQEGAKARAKNKGKEDKSSKSRGLFGFNRKKESTSEKKGGLFGFGKKKKEEKSSSKSSLLGRKSSSSTKKSGGSLFGKVAKSAAKSAGKSVVKRKR